MALIYICDIYHFLHRNHVTRTRYNSSYMGLGEKTLKCSTLNPRGIQLLYYYVILSCSLLYVTMMRCTAMVLILFIQKTTTNIDVRYCKINLVVFQNIVDATVIKIEDESPSVKRLILKIEDKTFSFKPGQW